PGDDRPASEGRRCPPAEEKLADRVDPPAAPPSVSIGGVSGGVSGNDLTITDAGWRLCAITTRGRPSYELDEGEVSVALERCEAVQLAGSVKALQLMDPCVLEGWPGAVEEFHDGRRHEDLAGP